MNQSIYHTIISAKYDSSLDHPITMYDQLPYKRDPDYCNASTVAMHSERMIKYYLCMNQEEACPINNRDDEIESILASIQSQELQRISQAAPEPKQAEPQDGITPEQIQTLLEDRDTETGKEPEQADAQNPFEGVDDW